MIAYISVIGMLNVGPLVRVPDEYPAQVRGYAEMLSIHGDKLGIRNYDICGDCLFSQASCYISSPAKAATS